jgi:hypothetical protein
MLLSQNARSGGKTTSAETLLFTRPRPGLQILSLGCLEYARSYFILKEENDNAAVANISGHNKITYRIRAARAPWPALFQRSLPPSPLVKALAGTPKSLQEIAAVGVH